MNELDLLQNQAQEVRLQDKLGKQNYYHQTEKLFEPVTDIIKNTSEIITKILTENSVNSNKAIENLNENILEMMNDKGLVTPYLGSPLVNLFKPENKSQFGLEKDPNSTKMNDFLINGGIPITLFSNMLIFEDSIKSFNLDGDLLETMTHYAFNVSRFNPKDQKLNYEFEKQMNLRLNNKDERVTEMNLC